MGNVEAFTISGYGFTEEEAINSLDAALAYRHGAQLMRDKDSGNIGIIYRDKWVRVDVYKRTDKPAAYCAFVSLR